MPLQVSALFQALAAVCAIYAAFTVESYAFLRYYNGCLGIACGLSLCVGIPVVEKIAREQLLAIRTLMLACLVEGFNCAAAICNTIKAMSMLLGELVGFFAACAIPFETATTVCGVLFLIGKVPAYLQLTSCVP